MPQILRKKGDPIVFEEFPINDKNLIKVNLVRNGTDSEGVWAALSDADKVKYDKNTTSKDYEVVCILQNSPLHFYPMNGWGAYVAIKFNGSNRPTSDLADFKGNIQFCKERRDAEAKAEKKDAKKKPAKAMKAKKKATVAV